MQIWTYSEIASDPASKLREAGSRCLFCKAPLKTYHDDNDGVGFSLFHFCPKCGWWVYLGRAWPDGAESTVVQMRAAAGSLKELDLADISVPIEEVRRYLVARYESRFGMHPRLFEETVGSVFRDLGYSVEVTGYSNDGGIDMFMRDSQETVGVQVKRHRHTIQVEQIRSLAGALVLGGLTKGAFVTTPSFTTGAPSVIAGYKSRGVAIELYDSTKFFDALNISQRQTYRSFDDLPFEETALLLDLSSVIDESVR